MYSIKGTKDIEFNYNISSIRKISDTEYQYHGKPNSPNLVLSNGIKRISYVAERIEIKQEELIIHHSATSNFPNKAMVIFPLVVSEGRVTTIDRLLGMEMNETLDLDIGSEITDFTMEINETQKSAYVVRLSGGLPISKKPTIIEGLSSCGLSALEQTEMERLKDHVNKQNGENPHNTKVTPDEFQTLLDGWLDTSKCYKGGVHYMKDSEEAVVSMNDGEISGASPSTPEAPGVKELDSDECLTIDGSKGIGDGGGDGGLSPNQEMECFPNEGGVFNMKFHIIYDISGTEEFIADVGVDLVTDDKLNNKGKNNKTLRDAMNAEVKNLKEHIEKLGGIYVPKVDDYDSDFRTNTDYQYIQSDDGTTIKTPLTFFTKNPVDIFITYIANKDASKETIPGNQAQIIKFSDISDATINGIGDLKKPHEAKECILVGVKQGIGDPLLMNAKKFSEDYLNKDFNRYTHISIPGYMSATENQSMKAIMALLGTIFASSIAYYTIPGFYKIAIKKITRNNRDCGEGYENYYKATAFNYLFTIITIVIPLIIIGITGPNGVLYGLIAFGIILILAIKARYALDSIFFYSFYPLKCNKTTKFREEEEYGSRFKVFTYIPASMSALFSG